MDQPSDNPLHHTDFRNPEEITSNLLNIVRNVVQELHPNRRVIQRIDLDVSLDRDLGLDSLTRVELLTRVEKHFEITLPERAFVDAETPRDLIRNIISAGAAGKAAALPEIKPLDIVEAEAAPSSSQTLIDVLLWHVRVHPDRPHIKFYRDDGNGETITYAQLLSGAEGVAAGLQHRGLHPGEPVAIMLPTAADYFYAFFGILLAGGVPVSMYPPARKTQIEEHLRRHRAILKNCGAGMLITIPEAGGFAKLLKSMVETLDKMVTVDELTSETAVWHRPLVKAQDLAFLQYSSGSTGDPKGVILTHQNLLANIRAMGAAVQVDSTDVFVSWLPLYHDMGLIGAWLGSLYFATLLIIMSPLDFLTRPQRWLRAIHQYRGTLSAAPNFAYEICLHRLSDTDIEGLDLSCWRAAFNGAEPVSAHSLMQFCERFREYGFRCESLMPVYGLAECSVGLAFPPLNRGPLIDRIQRDAFMRRGQAIAADQNDPEAIDAVACGHPLSGHEIRIVDPAGRELPERQEGRLHFRGPSACSGYFRNSEKTRLLFDGDWLDSGDLAYIAEGDVFITGRIKDVIIRAGRNIYPQELEEAVSHTPGIRKGNVVVFGSPDPVSGTERLIVIAETHEKDTHERDRMRREISSLATDLTTIPPDDVVLAPPGSVLKTSSGKIRRSANRELYEKGRIGKPPAGVWRQTLTAALSGFVPILRRFRQIVTSVSYAAYAWLAFALLAPLVWLIAVGIPAPARRWSLLRSMGRFLAWMTRIRLTSEGNENLPQDRSFVMVANHASYLDSLVLVSSLPVEMSFVAKAELKKVFGIGFFLHRLKTVYVERFDRRKSIEDARRIGAVIDEGRALMYFPEGTFTRMPGLTPFRMGAFLTAAETGVPVVPVAIRGARSILRSDSWFPRRGAVSVIIGAPIDSPLPADGTDADVWSTAITLRDQARRHILRHCGEPDLANESLDR